MDLERVVPLVVDFLAAEGHPVALVGALGLHAHGVTRATIDLDLVTLRDAQAALVPFLEGAGYETLYRSEGYSNHAHADPLFGRVDVVYVDAATGRRLFGGCRAQLSIAGRRLPVPRAEHLIAMKVQVIKNDPKRAFKDLAEEGLKGGGESSEAVMAGISEALVATAVGLLVAIPAVVAYNVFQRRVKRTMGEAEALGLRDAKQRDVARNVLVRLVVGGLPVEPVADAVRAPFGHVLVGDRRAAVVARGGKRVVVVAIAHLPAPRFRMTA